MPAPVAVAATAAVTPAPVQTSAAKAPAEPSKAGPEGAPKPPAEAPKPPEPRRFKAKYKADGKEQELDLDEAEAVREIQKARHYDKTRNDFEKAQREHNERMARLEKDPLGYLRERGLDLAELGRQEAARQAELEALTPEARRAAEAEQRAQALEEKLKARDAEAKQATERAEHQQLVQRTARKFDAAMKVSGRQRSGELLKTYAEVEEMAHRAGEPDLSPEQLVAAADRLETSRIAGLVKRATTDAAWRARNAPLMSELAKSILPALEGPELLDFIGKDNGARISKALLVAYRKNPLPDATEPAGTPPPKPAEPRQERQSASVWDILDNLQR